MIVEAPAEFDAEQYATYIINQGSSEGARRWLEGLELKIQDLAEMPRRFKVIPEQSWFDIELRQFLYHSHRVIFHVRDEANSVHVLRVYHGSQDVLIPSDVATP